MDDDCELVAMNHEDQVLTIVDDACYKILRTWTLINWCIYDDNQPATDLGIPLPIPGTYKDDDGYFKYVQKIIIIDEVPPTVSFVEPDDCDYSDDCTGSVTLSCIVSDDCSDLSDLNVEWKMDLFSDGTFDVSGSGNDASGTYPYGDHQIKWIVSDGCGNQNSGLFECGIRDCKAPTPVCSGVIVEVMNEGDGCVAIWPNDLLEYAFDNCSTDEFVENSAAIRRAGDTNPPSGSVEICCADVPFGQVIVEVWVTDEAGNSDYCEVVVVAQDNSESCPELGTGSANIAGEILRETDMTVVEQVMVDVNGSTSMTGLNGGFLFPGLNVGNNYTVSPEKDINPLNGVTTYDLVLISQHIIGITPLSSPYKLIAADVNGDGDVTTFDMVQLRQMILYVITDFPTNKSWRFVDMDYVFPDPLDPWSQAFPELINVPALPNSGELLADFIGVKVGDVNNSAVPNTLLGNEDRNLSSSLVLGIEDQDLEEGNTYEVSFKAQNFEEILGYQFTLSFDKTKLSFEKVKAASLEINESNFGMSLLDEGIITTSYHELAPITVSNDEVLFTMTFRAAANVKLSEALSLTSRYTEAEAYDTEGVLDVALGFNTLLGTMISAGEFELLQNKPNPFNESTLIGFSLPEAAHATIRIYDVAGKTLKVISQNFNRGYNEVVIERNELQATGVLYYQLDTDKHSAIKKMIIID